MIPEQLMNTLALGSLIACILVVSAVAQTKAPKPAGKNVDGYAFGPVILKDAACARDYAKALKATGVDGRKQIAELSQYGCLEPTDEDVLYYVAGQLETVAGIRFVNGCQAAATDVMKEVDPSWRRTGGGSAGACGLVPSNQVLFLSKSAVVARLKAERKHP